MTRHTSDKNRPAPAERLDIIRAKVAQATDKFIENRFWVPQDEDGALVPFKFRWPQRKAYDIYKEELESGRPVRLWFLKARRVGLTSLFAADDLADAWSRDNRRVGIVAHNDERARRILAMCKSFHRRLPTGLQLPLSKDATAGLKFADHDSELVIGTCAKPEKVRGDGLHRAHLTEAPYYKRQYNPTLEEVVMTIAAAPRTVVIIEGTGKARGSSAHKHWQAARDGDDVFRAVFLAWLDDPTCVKSFTDDVHKKDIMEEIMFYEPRIIEKSQFFKLSAEQTHWLWIQYLYKAKQNYELLCTEFPFNEEEAWTAAGTAFFGANEIAKVKSQPPANLFTFVGRVLNKTFSALTDLEVTKKVQDDEGPLYIKLWAPPTPGHRYVIGSDSSYGEQGSTFSAGYVIDMRTREMMLTYHGRIRPDEHACLLASLGNIYNQAIVCPEVNPGGGGMTILDYLYRLGYYYIYQWRYRDSIEGHQLTSKAGWWTNQNTRMIALTELRKMFQDCANERFPDPGMFRDSALINEMRGFHVDPETGRAEASEDSYDDRIMALAIAHQVAADEVKGGALDIYGSYPLEQNKTNKLIDLYDRMEENFNGPNPVDVINKLTNRDFDLEEGIIKWH